VKISGDLGWICGDAGTILMTSDGGQNWDTMVSGTSEVLYYLTQQIQNVIVAAGDNGVILKSIDGGITWNQELVHAEYSFYGISMDGGRVIAVGDLGMVLSNGSYPTPVELRSFTAGYSGSSVNLQWETLSEINNFGFEVQRNDGDEWTAVGFVPAHTDGASARIGYAFTDSGLPESVRTLRYRLRQIDLDGSFWISPELEVAIRAPQPVECTLSQNYPNPFSTSTVIQLQVGPLENLSKKSPPRLEIFDHLGRRILDVSDQLHSVDGLNRYFSASVTIHSWQFPCGGAYFYRLRAGDQVLTRSMLMSR
jgi:hypothetical protein